MKQKIKYAEVFRSTVGAMILTARFYVIMAFFLMAPCVAFGDVRDFIPRIVDYKGELEVYGSYEKDSAGSGDSALLAKNMYARERLNLSALGFVFHRRFIQLKLKISAGLEHRNFQSGPDAVPWSSARSTEFDLRAMVLPYHPYRLELFTQRLEPYTGIGGMATTAPTVIFVNGARFKYKKKPYFLNLSYVRNSSESPNIRTVTNSYSMSGTYFKKYARERILELSLIYHHSDSSATNGLQTSGNFLELDNMLKRDKIEIGTRLKYDTYGQEDDRRNLTNKKISWFQRLAISLPHNFKVNASYDINKYTVSTTGETLPENTTSVGIKGGEFSLTHRLFSSLVTQYLLTYVSSNSSESDSKMLSNGLTLRYTKKIPWGVFNANMAAGRSHTDRSGDVRVLDEPHSDVSVPGPVVIASQDVDPSSISLLVKSKTPPFERVSLVRDIHYTVAVEPSGFLRVNIVFLPPEFIIPGTFDFIVSYSLIGRRDVSDVSTMTYDLSLDLFGKSISPYYIHTTIKNERSAGSEGLSGDRTLDLFGLRAQKWGFYLTLERENVKDSLEPSATTRGILEYRNNDWLNLSLYSSVSYERTNFPLGSLVSRGAGYTEQYMKVQAGISRGFFGKRVLASLAGNYQTATGLTRTRSYAGNSVIYVKAGKMNIELGANLSMALTDTAAGTERRSYSRYYLNLKKELF